MYGLMGQLLDMFGQLTLQVMAGLTTVIHRGSTESAISRLHNVSAIVSQICDISGVPSASVGILHRGKIIFRENFGYQDVAAKRSPTSDTQYCIGSLTKSFTASSLAVLLADQQKFQWSSPLCEVLPDYEPKDRNLHGLVSIADFLSHRTGLLGDMSTALQGDWEFLLPPDDLIPTVGDLETVAPFRQNWLYNNWGYGIQVIEKLSGQTFHDYLQNTVIQPLGLANTTTRPSLEGNADIAVPYAALQNGTVHPYPIRFPFRDSLFEAAGGIFSTVNDLLKYVQAVLIAERDATSRPLRDLRILLSNQIPLDEISRDYRFYGMGWIRTQLPGVVGLQGDNAELFDWDELPVLGKGAPAKMVYYHQDASFGYYSAALMFPETESGIVVLTNSMPLNDAADWIAQAYTNALFQFPQSADYVELAKESRRRKLANIAEVKTTFDKIRQEHPGAARPLDTYTGKYYNSLGNFYIQVTKHQEESSEKLVISFQGRETQVYDLRHLQGDTFEWALQYDESARRARFAIWDPEYFKIDFHVSDGNSSSTLSWAKVTDVLPQGLTMSRGVGSS